MATNTVRLFKKHVAIIIPRYETESFNRNFLILHMDIHDFLHYRHFLNSCVNSATVRFFENGRLSLTSTLFKMLSATDVKKQSPSPETLILSILLS